MKSNDRLFSFIGGKNGQWQVTSDRIVKGDPLDRVTHLSVRCGDRSNSTLVNGLHNSWMLQGVTSNTRYVKNKEKGELTEVEPAIGRTEATLAALIPLRKNDKWWSLTQEDRREIFHRSAHHQKGLSALPAIARRLHHCRDLASAEPFDFITWFEFAPQHLAIFNELLSALRETEEWSYIDREYEVRLERCLD